MIVAAWVFAVIAAGLHVYFFYLESLAWMKPSTRATFGVKSEEEARITRSLAFNQGFYNLFLAVLVAVGVIDMMVDSQTVGATLIFAGAGCMAAAGLVLLISSPSKARAALIQLVPPLAAVILLAAGLMLQ